MGFSTARCFAGTGLSTATTVCDAAGFDGRALVAATQDDAVKHELRAATEEAERVGVCGAPCFVVGVGRIPTELLFWGQDRLVFVEKALEGWHPRAESG